MTEDEALQLYCEYHYPLNCGSTTEEMYQIMEVERKSLGFLRFNAYIAIEGLKDSIRAALPKWLKWII
jgi:hypothetical protein